MKLNTNSKRIVLASNSPRRKELLEKLGLTFEVVVKHTEEIHPANTLPEDIPLILARHKAGAVVSVVGVEPIVIAADTIVIQQGKIFEKPTDRNDAIQMLQQLSGKPHTVVTGVCILHGDKEVAFSDTTEVFFNELSLDEIEYYVDNYKPYDKAGSYACQEWIGAVAIKCFEGDFFNVVGLPINKVYAALKNIV
jgi:septum formation protein